MKLYEYLESQSINVAGFARRIGVSNRTMWNILRGDGIKLSTAMHIEHATDGRVTCQDLYATMINRSTDAS